MTSIWHFALAVPDLEEAMEQVGRAFQVTWRPIHRAETVLHDENGNDHQVECVFTFSEGGPPSIEMWQAVPGTPLATPGDTWLHHIGYWADDLPAAAVRTGGAGLPGFMNAPTATAPRAPRG
ncbi:MAG: VOC family protein, partial [Acidimicrobiaceae bacterium]|nr:VOC family protein [Acidimicrobiaceae bacterium]